MKTTDFDLYERVMNVTRSNPALNPRKIAVVLESQGVDPPPLRRIYDWIRKGIRPRGYRPVNRGVVPLPEKESIEALRIFALGRATLDPADRVARSITSLIEWADSAKRAAAHEAAILNEAADVDEAVEAVEFEEYAIPAGLDVTLNGAGDYASMETESGWQCWLERARRARNRS